jgi:ribosomal protein S27AE
MAAVPGQLKLACPRCGQGVLVPWERLDRRVFCRRCRQWYRLDRGGLSEVPAPGEPLDMAVRSGFSAWWRHQVLWSRVRQSAGGGRRPWASRLASLGASPRRAALGLAIVVAACGAATAVRHWHGQAEPPQAALPEALPERAAWWSEAWLRQDVERMLRMVEPSLDRDLRRWLAQNPPPAQFDSTQHGAAEVAVVAIRRQGPRGSPAAGPMFGPRALWQVPDLAPDQVAEVTVRLLLDLGDGRQQTISQKQLWLCRGGVWYYAPRFLPGATRRA